MIWIISPIVFTYFGLEISNKDIEQSFEEIRFFGVPICVLLTLFGTIKPNDKTNEIVAKALWTLGATVFSVLFMIVVVFTGICNWTTLETIYIHKMDADLKIAKRDYGCGALDSSPPINDTFKIRKLSKYLIMVSETNLDKIEKNKWIKVDNNK